MMTALVAVDSLLNNKSKKEIWNVNTEDDYHEEKENEV